MSSFLVNSFEFVVSSDVVKVVVSDVMAASTDSVDEFSSSFVALSSSASHFAVDVCSVEFAVVAGGGVVLAIFQNKGTFINYVIKDNAVGHKNPGNLW